MSYARMPTLPKETPEEIADEKIFKKPPVVMETIEEENKVIHTDNEEKNLIPPPQKEEKKKHDLKAHLAKCREKSIAVRKAKAEQKKKEKRPVGRPRKKKVVEEAIPLPVTQDTEEVEPNRVVEEPKEIQETRRVKSVEEQNPVQKQHQIDYELLADMLATKMKPTPHSQPHHFQSQPREIPKRNQPQTPAEYINNNSMGNFLDSYSNMIREQERKKMKEEAERNRQQKQQEKLQSATQRYYQKLPPVSLIQSDNAWDNCFNGKR